jgi:hypothetical protein
MAQLIDLLTYNDKRGNLTVIERIIPFEIKRIFYIYGVDDSIRGGHRHKTTFQAAICLRGSCSIHSNNGSSKINYLLDNPSKCLLIDPEDWHIMDQFSPDAILMVLASTYYNADDYIYQPYL